VSGISSVQPLRALEGGRLTIEGAGLIENGGIPEVRIGGQAARVVRASARSVSVVVPTDLDSGRNSIKIDTVPGETAFVEVGDPFVTGLHQVDNPVYDQEGNVYATCSGSRGQQTAVSVYRVRPDGLREPFVSGITNATSLAIDRRGRLHVSSRFDGAVYRIDREGSTQTIATDLGVACGLAFDPDGNLFVGDRSGTIFRITPAGDTVPFATLPPSVAAFHLASAADGSLYVTGPTLSPTDTVYRILQDGTVSTLDVVFGRPQGLALDPDGVLYVAEALAGSAGLYRLRPGTAPELIVSASAIVGVAFDPRGGMVVASNDTIFRFEN
jgi:hypothetical protein